MKRWAEGPDQARRAQGRADSEPRACQTQTSIAIAARAHAPILVHPSVMESAGVEPDKDMPETGTATPARREPPPPMTEDASDRLSVFKDFIEKLDIDNPDKDKPDSPPA